MVATAGRGESEALQQGRREGRCESRCRVIGDCWHSPPAPSQRTIVFVSFCWAPQLRNWLHKCLMLLFKLEIFVVLLSNLIERYESIRQALKWAPNKKRRAWPWSVILLTVQIFSDSGCRIIDGPNRLYGASFLFISQPQYCLLTPFLY